MGTVRLTSFKVACFVKKEKMQLIWTSRYKEVNRTNPSSLLRIPCSNRRVRFGRRHFGGFKNLFPGPWLSVGLPRIGVIAPVVVQSAKIVTTGSDGIKLFYP